MPGIHGLQKLLATLRPELQPDHFVFCTVPSCSLPEQVEPLATFREQEGLTMVLGKEQAVQLGLAFEGAFRQITLTVHSSLTAVGLTAAVANQLTKIGISANVIAAYYHDHVFVPEDDAQRALQALIHLSEEAGG